MQFTFFFSILFDKHDYQMILDIDWS